MAQPRQMLEGHRFGLLQILRFVEVKDRHAMFEAECACGILVIVRGSDLLSLTKRKCGPDCTFQPHKFRAVFNTIADGHVETKSSQ